MHIYMYMYVTTTVLKVHQHTNLSDTDICGMGESVLISEVPFQGLKNYISMVHVHVSTCRMV